MVAAVLRDSLLEVQDGGFSWTPRLIVANSHDFNDVANLAFSLEILVHFPNHLHNVVNVEDAEACNLLCRFDAVLPSQRTVSMTRRRNEVATVTASSATDECPGL